MSGFIVQGMYKDIRPTTFKEDVVNVLTVSLLENKHRYFFEIPIQQPSLTIDRIKNLPDSRKGIT